MQNVTLGRSGLTVSRLCIGALTVGPLQANLPLEQGAEVLSYAFSRGIRFLDTAQYYECYPVIREALRRAGQPDVVISSKTYAYTAETAVEAVEEARKALDRDVIDLFMLHEQESYLTLRGHMPALEALFSLREKGVVRAVGASMHHVAAVDGVTRLSELYPLDVVHPIFNMTGVGIADGTVGDMKAALARAREKNVGVFAMKPLGGGHLLSRAAEAFDFVLDSGLCDAVACGMQSAAEVDANVSYFESRSFPPDAAAALAAKKRRLHIEDYCEGCGRCADRCGQKALSVVAEPDGSRHAVVDPDRCVLCGYCAKVCPVFACKVL